MFGLKLIKAAANCFCRVSLAVGFIAVVNSSSALADTAPKKSSSIEVTANTSKKDGKTSLVFKVVPAENMVINEDGPWKLEIKDAAGLTLAKNKLEKGDIDFKIPGYSVDVTKGGSSNKKSATAKAVAYKMIVFVCTKDKTTCVRDVHDGKADVTL